jgi:hypothetical protein
MDDFIISMDYFIFEIDYLKTGRYLENYEKKSGF